MGTIHHERKSPRANWHEYDGGDYFVTICTKNQFHYFGEIKNDEIILTDIGIYLKSQIDNLQNHYPFAEVLLYTIMPNHIHIIFLYDEDAMEKDPRPTIMDVVCGFKSITTKRCKEILPIRKLFQTSFHDHVIRNREDYEKIRKYIYENQNNRRGLAWIGCKNGFRMYYSIAGW